MKVKLLKKLRKRFEWKWDESIGEFCIFDHKKKISDSFDSSEDVLLYMQGSSLFTGLFIEDLTLRFYRRNERVSYYRLLKAIGLK